MPILTAKSIVFIEFENLLYDTDTFVVQKVYDKYKDDREHCPCLELLDRIDRNGIENMKYISQVKMNINPIMEYMNDNVDNPLDVANDIYESIMYAEYGTTEQFDDLNKTTVGNSIDMIMRDEHFQTMYIFCNNPTPEIYDFIYSMYDDRIIIISGDKSDFLQTVPCTAYFISDATNILDIMEIERDEDDIVEIYIPEYKFTMDEDGIILIDPPIKELTKDNSINVATIGLPIV